MTSRDRARFHHTCPTDLCPHPLALHERDEALPLVERCTVTDCDCSGVTVRPIPPNVLGKAS